MKQGSTIEYLKNFVDVQNAYYINDSRFDVRATNEFIESISEEWLYLLKWVNSITFIDATVIIRKLVKPKEHNYERVTIGKICPVSYFAGCSQ